MSYLLGLSGSLRRDSSNTKLIRAAANIYGGRFVEADLRLPLYDGDLEQAEGIPEGVQTLAEQIEGAEALIISTPEYNKAISGVLKNALDWISRTDMFPWDGKPVAIMSAAAGRAGGERTQFSLRLCLVAFRPTIVAGPEVLLAQGREQFNEDGTLKNERYEKSLTTLMDTLKAAVR